MTHIHRTECRHCGTELGYLDHCCPNPRCGEATDAAPRVAPYATNPQRRLRRLKRRLEEVAPGGMRSEFAPFPSPGTMFIGNPMRWDDDPQDDAANGASNRQYSDRIQCLEQLYRAELEWACKTAMTAVGGTW